jgi:hypothetical protein
MARSYYYLIDLLDKEKAVIIKKSLSVVPGIEKILVSASQGMVEVRAKMDPEDQVRLACDVAKANYRTSVKRDW